MHDPFKCPHCSKFHKAGHPKPEQQKTAKEKDDGPFVQHLPIRQFFTYKLEGDFPEPEPLPDIQMTEPVIGWRVWKYNDGYLRSVVRTEFSWPHRLPLKKDIYQDAGIHFVKTYKAALPLLAEYLSGPSFFNPALTKTPSIAVVGSCSLWGDVKEHDWGYLAEFAYPKELFVGTETDPLMIMQIEENYGVPVQIRDEVHPSLEGVFEYLWNFGRPPTRMPVPLSVLSKFIASPPGIVPVNKAPDQHHSVNTKGDLNGDCKDSRKESSQ